MRAAVLGTSPLRHRRFTSLRDAPSIRECGLHGLVGIPPGTLQGRLAAPAAPGRRIRFGPAPPLRHLARYSQSQFSRGARLLAARLMAGLCVRSSRTTHQALCTRHYAPSTAHQAPCTRHYAPSTTHCRAFVKPAKRALSCAAKAAFRVRRQGGTRRVATEISRRSRQRLEAGRGIDGANRRQAIRLAAGFVVARSATPLCALCALCG